MTDGTTMLGSSRTRNAMKKILNDGYDSGSDNDSDDDGKHLE